MATLDALQARLGRGLDPDKQNPAHDAIWLDLLAEYERVCDDLTATCRRRDHVGAQLDARQAAGGRWTEQRLTGVR